MLAELPVQSTWWGWYDVSPDWNALVGEAPEVSRFLYATGFSGHGFQQAPAVGEHLAELVVGRTPTLDLSPFSAERFAAGAERPETSCLSSTSSASGRATCAGRACRRRGTRADQYVGVCVRRCGYICVAYRDASACDSATDAPSLFATNQIDCMP